MLGNCYSFNILDKRYCEYCSIDKKLTTDLSKITYIYMEFKNLFLPSIKGKIFPDNAYAGISLPDG